MGDRLGIYEAVLWWLLAWPMVVDSRDPMGLHDPDRIADHMQTGRRMINCLWRRPMVRTTALHGEQLCSKYFCLLLFNSLVLWVQGKCYIQQRGDQKQHRKHMFAKYALRKRKCRESIKYGVGSWFSLLSFNLCCLYKCNNFKDKENFWKTFTVSYWFYVTN